jgi:uncharacterized membrane protein YdjX (TVP38/TMEM64 family)
MGNAMFPLRSQRAWGNDARWRFLERGISVVRSALMERVPSSARASPSLAYSSDLSSSVEAIADHPWWIPAAGLLGFLLLAFAWFLLPLDEWLEQFSLWVNRFGVVGVIAFGVAIGLSTLLLMPGTPLSVAAAIAYGWWALPLILLADIISAAVAFVTTRHFLKGYVRSLVAKRPPMKAAEEAINEDGWKVIALVRLSPLIPFGIQNYLFGSTGVPLATYVVVTALAIVPGTLLNVSAGVLGRTAAERGASPLNWIFLGIGIVATVVVTILITRNARRKLRDQCGK